MTSNLGSEYAFMDDQKEKEKKYDELIKNYFKPEFINRIDEIIVFNPLNKEVIRDIARKFINNLELRLSKNDIRLNVTDRALDMMVEKGYDVNFGARPMKRYTEIY